MRRYLSFDGGQSLLVAANKVHVEKLGHIGALVGTSVAANHGNFPESI